MVELIAAAGPDRLTGVRVVGVDEHRWARDARIQQISRKFIDLFERVVLGQTSNSLNEQVSFRLLNADLRWGP